MIITKEKPKVFYSVLQILSDNAFPTIVETKLIDVNPMDAYFRAINELGKNEAFKNLRSIKLKPHDNFAAFATKDGKCMVMNLFDKESYENTFYPGHLKDYSGKQNVQRAINESAQAEKTIETLADMEIER